MALRRSASTRTTLSMYATRSTKYQKWLGSLNVLLLLGSIVLIFVGQNLKANTVHTNQPDKITKSPEFSTHINLISLFYFFQLNYYMDQLDMVHPYFKILPWVLVGSGILAFLLSTAGFIFSATIEVFC